jgi:predicted TIM-barrel fold metal-dependent hydrolase
LLKKDFAEKGFMKKFFEKNKIESMLTFRSPSSEDVRRSYGEDKMIVVPTVNNICVKDANSLEEISKLTETPIRNIDDILAGIDKLFKEYAAAGIKNIKFGSAYNREINYKARTRAEADASFAKIMATPFDYSDAKPNKYYVFHLEDYHIPLDDYLGVYMIKQAEKYNMNVIFHVGIFAWNFNSVKNNHASSLEWLIKNFPTVNFVILHAGYPYFDEAILLAKYYPNVYINMTWDHIIERGISIDIMKRYIEMLPTSKIHLFGGDYLYPQQIYGSLIFTKENLYITLSELIKKGLMREEQAKKIAIDWLYNNPKAFYYR